ncbi:MAG: hypothetical protein FJ224_02755 [Lentisphaerae bacterium]|nr:hypothetical protein [Lentisphaerota bacterium]
MTRHAVLAGFVVASIAVSAPAVEKYCLIKETDRAKKETYRVVTAEECEKLEKELDREEKSFSRALMNAQRRFDDLESYERKTFPRSACAPRKLAVVSTYTDQSKANERLRDYQTRIKEAQDKEKKEQGKKKNKGVSKSEPERKKAREDEQQQMFDDVRRIFEEELQKLMAGAPAAVQPDAAGEAPPAKH